MLYTNDWYTNDIRIKVPEFLVDRRRNIEGENKLISFCAHSEKFPISRPFFCGGRCFGASSPQESRY